MISVRLLFQGMIAAAVTIAPLSAQTPVEGTVETYRRVISGHLRDDGLTSMGVVHRSTLVPGDYIPHSVIVKTKGYYTFGKEVNAFPSAELMRVLAPYGVTRIRAPFPEFAPGMIVRADRYGLGRIYEVTFSAEASVVELCARLAECSDVEYAEPLFIRRTCGTPDDPRYSAQYAMRKAQAEGAWEISKGDTSVTIAIIDSGVDWEHEDLAANIWTNWKEIPDNDVDDDGNGKVDDVRGWDFVGAVPYFQALLNSFREDNDPKVDSTMAEGDGRHHGTHVAGVAGATVDNGKGIAGMGYHCRLIPVKVGSDAIPGNIFRGYEAILYAATLGADIINCSWGGGPYAQAEQDVINQAMEMGSLVVAAAGNEGADIDNFSHYPSSYNGVLAVGATGQEDAAAGFSNYGITTRVFAPGVKILSTISGADRYAADSWSGTSMATPLVSGIAALIKSLHPDWSPAQIARQIRSAVDNVVVDDSTARPKFYGRVNAQRALEMNRDDAASQTAPGIDIVEVGIRTPNGIITDIDPTEVRLDLRNYLGVARNVRVTIIPLGDDVSLDVETFVFDSLAHDEEAVINMTVTMNQSAVWFQGTADLLVRLDGDGYLDYDLVRIPYLFDSPNTYTTALLGLPGNTVARAGHSPSPGVLWGVGELPGLGGGYIRFNNGSVSYNFISPTGLTCVYAFDANRAYTASGPILFSTTNGGTGWKNTALQTITPSIQNINFFSTTNGIALGDPIGTRWGVAVTTDGGATWNKGDGAPEASSGERLPDDAAFWLGDNGWFGTTGGHVFRTTDQGKSWEEATVASGISITHLAFRDPLRGVALYHDGADTEGRALVASTTDGGATWRTGVADLSPLAVRPVHLSAPGSNGVYVVMGDDGRVAISGNDGGIWNGVPTYKTNGVISAGTSAANQSTVRLWNLGTAIGFLDFNLGASAAPSQGETISGLQIVGLYPNPARDRVTVEAVIDHHGQVEGILIDLLGREVARAVARPASAGIVRLEFDAASLPGGVYWCRVTVDDVQHIACVTIER